MSIHSFYGMIPAMALAEQTTGKRTLNRERRRRQLIEATMKCIGRKGISGTTLGDVAAEAGLSQGIVNLHFESKDNLLKETLRSLADDYRAQFDTALGKSGPLPEEKLLALMELDLRPSVCERNKLAVWFAFWGEVKSRPTYRKICEEGDRYYDDIVEALCADIIRDGKYAVSATAITLALMSMTNGLWLDCLISPQAWNRQESMSAVLGYLSAVFPKHFDPPQE